ncbi:MAG: phage tail protein I [Chloroflexi bacterium]|nr:phage tail protein I [Chloroflexota bacterium]MCI0579259.1 phage tail protein I [Chloroflexota bacterium]MCI0649384.1 phage tail protein I [Chloroflexota bacterium]MCI0727021.1 phage tail protein I [Chloroflexota bacterium]
MARQLIGKVTVTGPEIAEELALSQGGITIGRQEGNDLRLNHPLVSRQHARLEWTAEGCLIIDLGSANGTTINGERLAANAPIPLDHGTVVEIGPYRLLYEQIEVMATDVVEKGEELILPAGAASDGNGRTMEQRQPALPVEPLVVRAPAPPAVESTRPAPGFDELPPGLSQTGSRYLDYLPGIYHTDFMARFLALFESILTPIEWNVGNFDLYLDPRTAPPDFLPWLANWFEIAFDPTWSEEQRRTLLAEASQIYERRGTRWALSRVLEIYTGARPEIVDEEPDADPFTFTVKLPLAEKEVDRTLIERIIDTSKPAHTNYRLLFKQAKNKR